MKKKSVNDVIQELNKQLTNNKSIDLFVDFYDRLLSGVSSVRDLSYTSKLYCLYNVNNEKVMLSEKRSVKNFNDFNSFVFEIGSELIDLINENKDCYIAAEDFISMPRYKTHDRLEAITFIAKEGMNCFKPITVDQYDLDDKSILDKAYDQIVPFSILELDQKVEVAAKWLEQVLPGKSKEFFEGLDSFEEVKAKLLNFEVKRDSLFDDVLRPLYALERLMQKNLISKTEYLEKISEFYELKKDLGIFNKHNVDVLFTWILIGPIYKDQNSNNLSFNMIEKNEFYENKNDKKPYELEQLSKISKETLIKFLKTINSLNKEFPGLENSSLKITQPIVEIL